MNAGWDRFLDTGRIPLGKWVESVETFVTTNLSGLFDVIRAVFKGLYDAVDTVFAGPPFWVMILILVLAGLWVRGWKFALGTLAGLLLVVGVSQWENAMHTLALVIVASLIALIIALPLGILTARSDTASAIVRPVLDFLQTMPAFVYLIPALVLFRVGVVPGIVATIMFALAPGVRFTELGIRGVDREVVEAGHAFGASPGRILRQIQLPLAMPTIMAGVNQVIMLSLSMVVIAGMVGAEGLGTDVVSGLTQLNTGLGVEAGISVVILAVYLDRMTAALAKPRQRRFLAKRTAAASAA
ncbi:ABC transporter permease subunit [Mycetocola tolaasinivorans]|uniref:ABC transporter permease subunit n=2 Tax=Mycetocola tolaasinivorans TaxID=76635 RepID=A0A3L7A4V5_9MICO|nr:ABC transporter permease subunit [Mycetocola tolaasinivorans]